MERNEQLRRLRIGRNWRQQDLADQLGVTVVTVQRWERGSQHPSAYYRVKLCTLFGLGAQELGLVDEPPPPESTTADAAQAGSARSEDGPLWTVPYARNPHFTGRDDLLQQLGQLFAAEKPDQPMSIQQVALTQTQAITGLGGIGKTQIAIEYAYRARLQGRYRHTIWISAGNLETILTSFVELARLCMPVLVEEETNQRRIVAALLRWLEQCEQPWLLIFDNADDLSLVQPYLPRWGNGRILLTTRAHAVGAIASPLEVENMGVMEATHLLLRRAHRFSASSPEELDEAIMLVNALAQFPLAIDQAGAYIEETGCSLSDYLQRDTGNFVEAEQLYHRALAIREQHLGPEHPYTANALSNVANLYLAQRRYKEAEPLYRRALAIREQQFGPPQLDSDDHLHTLANFYVTQGLYREAEPLYQRILALREQRLGPLHYRTANILNNLAALYLSQGRYAEAEPLYRHVLTIREQQFGPTHPHTATSLYNLAVLQRDKGNFVEAERFYQRALVIRERQHLGAEHPSLADCLGGLATVYQKQGKTAQAEALALRALRIHERHLGPLHPSTADDLHTLALLYRDQGKPAEAGPLFLRALSIREQAFVSTPLSLAETLYEFALFQHVQGHNDEARPLYERALAARIHLLGTTHPLTVDTREQLIALLRSMGSTEQATQLERAQPGSTDLLREATLDRSRDESMEQSAAVAGTWSSVLPACPQCHQGGEIIKSGKNRSGSQRFRCRACQLYFTPQPGSRQPDQARKAQALALAEQGLSYRHIARQLSVHHQTVGAWISPHDAHGKE